MEEKSSKIFNQYIWVTAFLIYASIFGIVKHPYNIVLWISMTLYWAYSFVLVLKENEDEELPLFIDKERIYSDIIGFTFITLGLLWHDFQMYVYL